MNSKLTALKSYKYRHAQTLWLANEKKFPGRKKVNRVSVWFLVYEEHKARYNIYCNQIKNKQHAPLKSLLDLIHKKFITKKQDFFNKEAEITGLKIEILHLVAIHE